uniref:Putative regulator n=1 Tax=Micromonospora sp. ML1 TaxID=349725 RepID=Q333W4_9ACTN|nr:putative regulator [Micromonospora sp. ML1]
MSAGSRSSRNAVAALRVVPAATAGVPKQRPAEPAQVMLTRVGLRLPERMSFEHWERTGAQLSGIVDSSSWCLGDWLVYGKEQYADRYRHVVQAVGLDYQTLRNYAWVAGRFPLARRRSGLSFQHHAEVAAMSPDDQDRWLDEAETQMWSVKQLRAAIKATRSDRTTETIKTALMPRIPIPDRRLTRWRQAAHQSSVELDQWIVSTLDRAAAETLDKTTHDETE